MFRKNICMLLKTFIASVGKYTILPADILELFCNEPWGKVLEFSRKWVCGPIGSLSGYRKHNLPCKQPKCCLVLQTTPFTRCNHTGLIHRHWNQSQLWIVTLNNKFSIKFKQWTFLSQSYTAVIWTQTQRGSTPPQTQNTDTKSDTALPSADLPCSPEVWRAPVRISLLTLNLIGAVSAPG